MIIVDTTVLIDLWRGRTGVKECLAKNKEENFCISGITIEEIYDGLGYTKEKKDKDVYEQIKEQHEKILNDFHIIPLNLDIMKKSGLLRGELRAKGVIMDLADIIIMVTSQEIKAKKIITRNPKHFGDSHVQVESYEIN
ncbi:MAG: type II toxin-antitoxin system VapC family toxin [Promethearchaeota archaeon]